MMHKKPYVKNYTSSVPVVRTVAEIEEMLAEAGASHISKTYAQRKLTGFMFTLPVENHQSGSASPVVFRVPCEVEPVLAILAQGLKRGRRGYEASLERLRQQAERTAWRLVRDWISIELTRIRLQQVKALEVFLPYAWDARRSMTLFETYDAGGFKMLAAPERREE